MKLTSSHTLALAIGTLLIATAALITWFEVENGFVYFSIVVLGLAVVFHKRILLAFQRFLDLRHFTQDQINPADRSLVPRGLGQRSAILTHAFLEKCKAYSPTGPVSLGLFFFGLAASLVWFRPGLINPNENIFKDSVAPSLLVFCLDGLLIVGVLSYLNARKSRNEKEQLRVVLRAFLMKYPLTTATMLEMADDVHALLRHKHGSLIVLNNLPFKLLEASNKQRADFAEKIKDIASSDLIQAGSLTSIAALLGPAHVAIWSNTVNKIERLARSSESSLTHPLIDVLGAIIELDELNFKGESSDLNVQQMVNLREIP